MDEEEYRRRSEMVRKQYEERRRRRTAQTREMLKDKTPLEHLLLFDVGIYLVVHLLGRLWRQYGDDTP